MAVPIVRAHIHTLLIPISLLPLLPPLDSAPRTTTFCSQLPHHKTEQSSLYDGRQAQSATAPNLAAESRTPQ
ncbi:hypothetical protein BKA64DRAFT_688645 [Cadophora sp. MPI-SDFR-AT-0126]|nr:hypothetical protein BKA64DRAFT_688645 [Leotiomycetes sp. MPI-SDFR-AT-0126]